MPKIKTFATLLSELRTFIRAYNPTLDVSENSISSDLIMKPMAVGGELVFTEVGKIADLQILDKTSGDDLDNEGTNYGLERSAGTYAIGIVVFYSDTEPTGDIDIPSGTTVATKGEGFTAPAQFSTTQSLFVPYASRSAYYVSDTTRWEFPVPVQAVTIGSAGNVDTSQITVIQSSLVGITGVINDNPTTGGTDQEGDESFRYRIHLKKLGKSYGVTDGLEELLLEYGFSSVHAISVMDTESERVTGTDVFVIDDSTAEQVQTAVYYSGTRDYYVSKHPLLVVSKVEGSTFGTLTENIHYEVVRDTTSINRFSSLAEDKIHILDAGVLVLTEGEVLTITFTYASDIVSAQSYLQDPTRFNLAVNVLVKRAIKYTVTITAKVSFFANVVITTEKSNISQALTSFFDSFKLGDDIQLSDIEVVIQTGYGDYPISSVDQVILVSVVATSEFGDILTPVDETITLNSKAFARFGGITFA